MTLSLDDLRFPAEALFDAPRSAVLLYLSFRLHADEHGECRQAAWMSAMVGLSRDEYRLALDFLQERGFLQTFKYEGCYSLDTGVRLCNYKAAVLQERLPWQVWRDIRRRVFERDNFTCRYCELKFEIDVLECDHVEPISLGGPNELGNLVTACSTCNAKKRAKLIDAWKREQAV